MAAERSTRTEVTTDPGALIRHRFNLVNSALLSNPVQNLVKEHELQLVHYLSASKIDKGLLINFGSSVQVKRKFREYKPRRI